MTTRKQSSSRVSTLAARLMAMTRAGEFFWVNGLKFTRDSNVTKSIRTLCASVISQDEAKGQKPKKRRRRVA